ncbi:hypothetical protein, partial [Escherichia coli]|uniref:hypothetical protein n=1 Tax=Escherichia coli TaxID=562 RepID=UPI00256EE356
ITYLSDTGCLEIQGASLVRLRVVAAVSSLAVNTPDKKQEFRPLAARAKGGSVPTLHVVSRD